MNPTEGAKAAAPPTEAPTTPKATGCAASMQPLHRGKRGGRARRSQNAQGRANCARARAKRRRAQGGRRPPRPPPPLTAPPPPTAQGRRRVQPLLVSERGGLHAARREGSANCARKNFARHLRAICARPRPTRSPPSPQSQTRSPPERRRPKWLGGRGGGGWAAVTRAKARARRGMRAMARPLSQVVPSSHRRPCHRCGAPWSAARKEETKREPRAIGGKERKSGRGRVFSGFAPYERQKKALEGARLP